MLRRGGFRTAVALVGTCFLGLIGSQGSQAVNVLWVNEARNMVANKTVPMVQANLGTLSSGQGSVANWESLEVDEDAYSTVERICQKLDMMKAGAGSPDLILDTTLAGKSSEVMKSLSLTLGIPTVSMAYGDLMDSSEWSSLTDAQKKYLVPIRPPGDILPLIIREVVDKNEITNAAIVFDSDFEMEYKYRSLLQNVPVRHLINKMKMDMDAIKKHLQMLSNVDLNNIFLLGSPENSEMYLKAANDLKMYGERYSWFVVSKDPLDELKCDCDNMTVITMTPKPQGQDKTSTIVRSYGVDATAGPNIDISFYFDATVMALTGMTLLENSADWTALDIPKCEDFPEGNVADRSVNLLMHLEGLNLATHYGAIKAGSDYPFGLDFHVEVSSAEYVQSSLVKTTSIATWMALDNKPLQYESGKSLAQFAAKAVYSVAVVEQPPFVIKTVVDGKVTYSGYCIDLIKELQKLMQFQYELYEAPDGKYGRMDENTEWNGLVKELVDKKADIALGALSVMAERENVIDFTVPYYDLVGITIMMKKPDIPTSLFKFLTVLEDSVWGCILAAYFVTSLLMWIFDRWSPYSYQNNMEKYKDDDEKRYFNLKECLWFCMTSLTPQGGGEAPKNLSGRLVAATWWLFGFIIIASYTANLAAFLTVSRLETPVESLEDLSKQYKIQYSPMNGSATMTYFERMAYIEEKFYEIWKDLSLNDSLSDLERAKLAVWDYPVSDKYTKMWQSMRESGLPDTFDKALERVRDSPSSSEGYAFLGDATDIRYQVLTNCDLQMVGEEFSRKPYALAVQQGSPLRDQFNDAILKLLNQRTLETLKERWWNQNPLKKNCEDTDDSGGGISIYNIGGVFIVIFVGIGLAIVTLVIEYWYYKYKKPEVGSEGSSRSDSGGKKLQVKQALQTGQFSEKKDYETEYRTGGGSDIAPVGNPW